MSWYGVTYLLIRITYIVPFEYIQVSDTSFKPWPPRVAHLIPGRVHLEAKERQYLLPLI